MKKKEPGQLTEGWRIAITVWGFCFILLIIVLAVIAITRYVL